MNNNTADKVVSMREAVAQYVSDGSSVAIEGFTGFICFAAGHATLIDSALVGYEQFVAPMTRTQKTAYYDDSKRLARLFGIDEKLIPNNLNDFEKYMHQMMAGDEIMIDSTARSVSQDILYARPWIFKLAGPLFRLVTAGLLPARLREGYGLNWSARRAKLLAGFSKMVRFLLPWVPGVIRIVPNARAAEKVRRVTPH